MSLYDLSNPTNAPVLLSSWIVPGANNNNVGLGSVAFGGNRRYALETNNGLLALRILFPGGATNFTAAPCIHTYTSTTVIRETRV